MEADCINAWRFEASKLHKGRGWDSYRASDHVLVRYLAAGDARPLVDLLLNLSGQPGRRASEFIAAITDGRELLNLITGNSDLPLIDVRARFRHCAQPYEIRISERRGRGRPKAGPEDATNSEICLRLGFGFAGLAERKRPPREFWIDFAKALRFGEYGGQPFPFKAKVVRTDGRLGRRRDPGLEARDEALHFFVAKKIEGGMKKYEDALEEVRREIEALCKADRALGHAEIGLVERGTIRASYDRWSRRRRKP
jgi:hypothetical protein